jgi:hypothetical protein
MPELSLRENLIDDDWQDTEDIEDAEDDEDHEDNQVDFTRTAKIIAGGIALTILVPVLTVCWALSPFGGRA